MITPAEGVGGLERDEPVERCPQGATGAAGVVISEAVVGEDHVHRLDGADTGRLSFGSGDGAQGEVVAAGMGTSPSSIRRCECSNGVVACDADG